MNFNKICVIGLGYIGLPTASMFAIHGVHVVGVDINQDILATLNNGGLHIHEPGLHALVSHAFTSGNLCAQMAPEPADAFLIAVPTPFMDDKRADMRFVVSAAQAVVPYLQPGNLVILESTSPPRTTVNLVAPILEQSGLKAGKDFFLAYSPERVLPGQILKELQENARVCGGIDPCSAEAARDLYRVFVKGEIVLTDATTAEMVKLMENTYRDVNIAIANEFSRLADYFEIDANKAIQIANLHPRVNILHPGPGVGGHCISVDPWFLVEAAPHLTPLIKTARQVNDSQPDFVVSITKRIVGDLAGKKVAVLGLAYKPDVDDLRESPAIEIVHLLQKEGAVVKAFEPFKRNQKLTGISMAKCIEDALKDAEIILLLVAHSQFKNLDPKNIVGETMARTVIDTVDTLDKSTWAASGFSLMKSRGKN